VLDEDDWLELAGVDLDTPAATRRLSDTEDLLATAEVDLAGAADALLVWLDGPSEGLVCVPDDGETFPPMEITCENLRRLIDEHRELPARTTSLETLVLVARIAQLEAQISIRGEPSCGHGEDQEVVRTREELVIDLANQRARLAALLAGGRASPVAVVRSSRWLDWPGAPGYLDFSEQ
jgi:hypothetical protein